MDKRMKIAVAGTAIALIIIAIVVATSVINKKRPSKMTLDLTEYYEVPKGEALVIIEDMIYTKNALVIDDELYLDLSAVHTYYNKRFYWDSYENMLIYATPTELIKVENGSNVYYVNKNKNSMTHSIVKTKGEDVYISAEFVSLYSGLDYTLYTDPYRVMLNGKYGTFMYMDVEKATQIRVDPNIKSGILKNVEQGDRLMLVDDGGSQENGFVKVMTEDGVRGYVRKKHISEFYNIVKEDNYVWPEYSHLLSENKVNLTWHQVTNADANSSFTHLIDNTKGLTVVSPTWFRLNSVEGGITSLADQSYVDKAHNLGLEVWGLIDNFDKSIDLYDVLSRSSRRERLINEIIAEAIKYNLDGINIDFEELSLETGPHFIQFLRELSIKCRSNGLILSVDNYVPAPYNKFYDLEEQGIVVDYVIIMAYDEHYNGSETEGSVASISYVENAINDATAMISANQLIIAVPFYTRLWKKEVEDGQSKLTSEALGMRSAADVLDKNGIEAEWFDETCQYYAEYEKDGAWYYIWLEEEKSIEEKIRRIYDAGLSGVASWRLGFEKTEIWDVILKYIN